MNKNTINTIIDLMDKIDEKISDKSITVEKSKLGKEAIFNEEISEGIVFRIVNDGTYSIGGNATKKQKEDYIKDLKEIINDSSVGDLELKDFIYTIIDAVEESIENPSRNEEIKDGKYKISNLSEGKILSDLNKKMKKVSQSVPSTPETPTPETPTPETPTPETPTSETPTPETSTPETPTPETPTPETSTPETSTPETSTPETPTPETPTPETPTPETPTSETPTPETSTPETPTPETPTPESSETETNEFPEGRPSIVFNAIKGTYSLYINGKEIKSLKPEEAMDSNAYNNIITKAAQETGCKPRDLQSYLDPSVYMLLSMYDEKNNTDYANTFAKAAVNETDEKMPFDLLYELNKSNKADDLDKKDYKNIEIWAKNYKEQGIAEIKKAREEKDDTSRDNKKEGILSRLKSLGVGIFTAIVNFAGNVKDVITGKKKFRELFSKQAFKSLDVPKQESIVTKKKEEKQDHVQVESIMYINGEMVKLLNQVIKPGMEKEEEKKVLLDKVEKMAKSRGIKLEDETGNKKEFKQLRKEIVRYEAKRYEEKRH